MVLYNLQHLTQPENQKVCGPIQDDEALFLYSIVRGSRMRRVLEIGGLSDYSARNFIAALEHSGPDAKLYTVDLNPVPVLASNHRVILKNALNLTPADVDGQPLDMIFFDCHDIVQMDIFAKFVDIGIINDETTLALHDTNLHFAPHGLHQGPFVRDSAGHEGWAHQPVERDMVNRFKAMGYDVFSLHTTPDKHHEGFPFRHGVTVCQKFKQLNLKPCHHLLL